MKAALINELGHPFEVSEVEISAPLGREVLIELKASGLCHSDFSTRNNDFGFPVPILAGHEPAGIVTAVGPDVEGITVGDHVVGSTAGFCGYCENCLRDERAWCTNLGPLMRGPGQEPRVALSDGTPVTAAGNVGAFAEQLLLHENYVVKVPDEIPFEQASLLGCGVVTGLGVVLNAADVKAGSTVAVVGCGGVGMNAIQGARLAAASRIIAIDVADDKLELAKSFGATDTINSTTQDPVEAVRELTGGGVDISYEVVGLEPTLRQAFQMTRRGGMTYAVGVAKPGTELSVDIANDVVLGIKGIRGTYMGSTNIKRDIPFYADLYLQGRLNLDDLVAGTYSIDEINEGFDAMAGIVGRNILTF